ncbi:hypothetical protein AYK61_07585 [Rhodococcus sp. SBT000017]|nr:hypothetical protein AYK61_07585 [Rhodococcus sp. SBT000017]
MSAPSIRVLRATVSVMTQRSLSNVRTEGAHHERVLILATGAWVDIRPVPVTMSGREPERSFGHCSPVGRHVDRPASAYGDSR